MGRISLAGSVALILLTAGIASAQTILNFDGHDVALNGNVVLFDQPPRDPNAKPEAVSVIVPTGNTSADIKALAPDPSTKGGFLEAGTRSLVGENFCIVDQLDLFGPTGMTRWGQISTGCDSSQTSGTTILGWTDLNSPSFGANISAVIGK